MKIGVFDSGKGGLSFVKAINESLPNNEIIFASDTDHLPYGTKSPEEIYGYVLPILKDLESRGCKVIVVACNTVSTTLINKLRPDFNIPLIAVEPMVKKASEITRSGIVAVCATPTTLKSARYKQLKELYADNTSVLEPDCSTWAEMVEGNRVDQEVIKKEIDEVIDQGADVIVLGCTHYHWIEQLINEISLDKAMVIQPESSVIRQVKRVLSRLD